MYDLVSTKIPGVKIIQNKPFVDNRGELQLHYNKEEFERAGLPTDFVQQNVSQSFYGVLRGLHIQANNPQGKLIKCIAGTIQDVWVDLRQDSPTFKKWESTQLSMERHEALYLPPGLAHGFLCLTNFCYVHYSCTTPYDKESDGGVRWDDPKIGIIWDFESGFTPVVSPKDQALPRLDDYLSQLG